MYSLCCSVYSVGADCIRIRESVKEFQWPTAPKIAMVARMGLLSGQMILRKITIWVAPSICALSSNSAGMDSI